jgi:hypothetical protein
LVLDEIEALARLELFLPQEDETLDSLEFSFFGEIVGVIPKTDNRYVFVLNRGQEAVKVQDTFFQTIFQIFEPMVGFFVQNEEKYYRDHREEYCEKKDLPHTHLFL